MTQSEALVQLINAIRNATSEDEQDELQARLLNEINPRIELFIRRQSVGDHLEDLLQASLLEIIKSLEKFRGTFDAQFRAFCYTITRCVIAKHLRALKRNVVDTYDPGELERISEDCNLSIEKMLDFKYVIEVLRKLPKRCLELVTKRYVDGWEFQSIADFFGLSSADNVRMRISRCCQDVRALIQP